MSRPPSIVNAPYPFADESAASWIHRTCQLHGVTYKELTASLGIKRARDPDVAVPRNHVHHIGIGTGISATRLQQLADIFHAVRLHPPLKCLLNFHEEVPAYRYCPECLATDLTPYLRIGWRFKDWTICPEHHVQMLEQCPSCGAPVLGTTPCLGVADDKALGVGHCAVCNSALASATGSYQKVWASPKKLNTMETVVSSVRAGAFRIKGFALPLSLDLMLWLRDNPDRLKSCLARWAHYPQPMAIKYGVCDLIEVYCREQQERSAATELLYRRMLRDRNKRSTWAEKCYKATVTRQKP